MTHVNGTVLKGALDVLANISFIAYIPAAWYEWRRSKRRERSDRLQERAEHERETYAGTNSLYREFLQLCFDHPYLDIFEIPDELPQQLTPLQKKEERIAFAMLGAIFEYAFLLHSVHDNEDARRQWAGWDAHIREYCRRQNFREAWHQGVASYDPRFEAYIQQIEATTEITGTLTNAPASMSAPAPVR